MNNIPASVRQSGNGGDFYNNLFDLTPTDKARIYRNISNHYANKGLHDKALDYLRQWAKLDPNNPEPHFQLGMALATAGEYKKAVRAYDAAKASGDEAIPFEQAVEEIEQGLV